MSDPSAHALPSTHDSFDPKKATPVYVGGALGIGANFLGLAIFVAACFGLEGAFNFSPLPLGLGIVGLLLTVLGAVFRGKYAEDTHVVAGLFINAFAIVGGLLEFAAWQRWTILS